MNRNGFEIERKFLIEMPAAELLAAADRSEIVQTYLLGEKHTTERVRKRSRGTQCEYTHTCKRKVNSLRRIEDERQIGEAEYEALLGRADPKRRAVVKTRCCLEYAGLLWEIDLYPFWSDRAILEVELDEEEQRFELPPFLRVIREVTEDGRYRNSELARRGPPADAD